MVNVCCVKMNFIMKKVNVKNVILKIVKYAKVLKYVDNVLVIDFGMVKNVKNVQMDVSNVQEMVKNVYNVQLLNLFKKKK